MSQPIETAPHDRPVLVWVGQWVIARWLKAGYWQGERYIEGEWVGEEYTYEPTHWHDLPPSPHEDRNTYRRIHGRDKIDEVAPI